MAKPMTQKGIVLALLRDRGENGLTSLEALQRGAGMRLAHHIHVLRGEGYDIETKYEGRGAAKYARYVLRREDTLWRT